MAVALIAQSGGPTSVINASLLGVYEVAAKHSEISCLYGALNGVTGVLSENFIDLSKRDARLMMRVGKTPAAALGSSRQELTPEDLEHVVEIFRAHNIRYFFYNGGNGSMGTLSQLAATARTMSYELQAVGIPKTIDNDLLETDHTPGYPSTALFFACALRDIGADNRALAGQVEIVEILGRNVGWLAAATALARNAADDAPHLIYFPEVRLHTDALLSDVDQVYRKLGRCVVAVCEGQLNEHGEPFGSDVRSGSRGSLAMNLAHRLAMLIIERLRIKARSEKPGLLGRSTSLCHSSADWAEARACGQAAVQAGINGLGGNMVTLIRESDAPYCASTGLVPLERVAFRERVFPASWRNETDNDVTSEFISYLSPLVGPIAHYERLDARGS